MIISPINLSIQDYWKRVREIERDLPDVVTLASIPESSPAANPDECERATVAFIEADSLTAAKCLFAKTHRLATLEECGQRETKRVSDIRETARKHLAKQGVVAITLPDQGSSK